LDGKGQQDWGRIREENDAVPSTTSLAELPGGSRRRTDSDAKPRLREFIHTLRWLAFRFFQVPNGRRQILNFLLPGDLFSTVAVFDERLHFSAQTLTEARLSGFGRAEIKARWADNPRMTAALAKSSAAEAYNADGLMIALGQRSAEERIAYLFLHLIQRISTRSVIRDQRYRLPLRQQHIADAVGLTPVHVSRVISLFRDRGLIEFSGGVLQVLNLPELSRIGSLDY